MLVGCSGLGVSFATSQSISHLPPMPPPPMPPPPPPPMSP
eukprot:CAMPEP_0118971906 /NCGR_PEP_ID=MMETSP1173-20130426/8392_1 /TAXON_ID=1034831 /ORGANISM="Rhizochromulina marina cf, Strain CCMP1243" /LENGTH=39 /DNA_ID= /DNA_START= /DNA_END= /DNA_ORIENTATION=